MISEPLLILAYSLFGINVCVILICAVWLVLHWKTDEVRVSQPSFLLLVLLGCIISSSTILAMAQEDTNGNDPDSACMSIPILYSVGFCITFGTLFAKIRRVYIIYKSSAKMKRIRVTMWENVTVIGSVLLIDAVILIVWSVVDPLRWYRVIIAADQYGEALESQGTYFQYHQVLNEF